MSNVTFKVKYDDEHTGEVQHIYVFMHGVSDVSTILDNEFNVLLSFSDNNNGIAEAIKVALCVDSEKHLDVTPDEAQLIYQKAFAERKASSPWIGVNDRLPLPVGANRLIKSVNVLVFDSKTRPQEAQYDRRTQLYYKANTNECIDNITHWMPLPAPPQARKTEEYVMVKVLKPPMPKPYNNEISIEVTHPYDEVKGRVIKNDPNNPVKLFVEYKYWGNKQKHWIEPPMYRWC